MSTWASCFPTDARSLYSLLQVEFAGRVKKSMYGLLLQCVTWLLLGRKWSTIFCIIVTLLVEWEKLSTIFCCDIVGWVKKVVYCLLHCDIVDWVKKLIYINVTLLVKWRKVAYSPLLLFDVAGRVKKSYLHTQPSSLILPCCTHEEHFSTAFCFNLT